MLASNPATWRYVDTVVASSFVFTKALTRGGVVIGTLQPGLATVETKLRFSASYNLKKCDAEFLAFCAHLKLTICQDAIFLNTFGLLDTADGPIVLRGGCDCIHLDIRAPGESWSRGSPGLS